MCYVYILKIRRQYRHRFVSKIIVFSQANLCNIVLSRAQATTSLPCARGGVIAICDDGGVVNVNNPSPPSAELPLHKGALYNPSLDVAPKTKNPDRKYLSRTNTTIRGATLNSRKYVHFTGTTIPTASYACPALQSTEAGCRRPFNAPSAVHLTTRFLPYSQLRGLSVKSLSPLSPHLRFTLAQYSTRASLLSRVFL